MSKSFLFLILILLPITTQAQKSHFYFGHDLSYVNQMEDCGAEYRRHGIPVDPYSVFAEEGTNLVRARLWVDPEWWQAPLNQPEGVKPYYNDLEDVKLTFQRARNLGMELMLDIHYSDFWADPGRQLIPRQWVDVAWDVEALADSVYKYTIDVLAELESNGLMPEIVKIGNETNPGILVHIPEENGFGTAETVAEFNDFERHAVLFNAAIQAVRDAGATASINPKIALHWSNLNGVSWWYGQMTAAGVTDFDIIGFSYYYAWHGGSISQLQSVTEDLVSSFPGYEVMAVETGYLWSQEFGGIINEPDPDYLPVSPEMQLAYMIDYVQAVMFAGGTGVIFWEPAWVDTECVTPWQTGSSHTHVAFFDPIETNFMENGGGTWTRPEYYYSISIPEQTSTPEAITLHPNYPNPFNPVTQIRYEIPEAMEVRLSVYDVHGRIVKILSEGVQPSGLHSVQFDASNLASGIYFYRLRAGDVQVGRSMMLVK